MNAETFINISVLVSVLQIAEGLKLYASRGHLSALALAVSTLEFVWLLVCIYALFTISFPGWTILLPAAYLSYFIVVTWHSRTITANIETIEGVRDMTIPKHLVQISLSFGCFNLLLSAAAWLQYSGL